MPFIAVFLISWLAFLMFADYSKWRQFLPACLLAMVLSLASDIIVIQFVPLWSYHDPTNMIMPKLHVHLLDDFGIYPVVTYLFLQYYPSAKRQLRKWLYFFIWTANAISLEFLHHNMEWMKHGHGWSHLHSYIADWILLFILLKFYQVYNRQPVSSAGLYVIESQEDSDKPQIPSYEPFIRSLGMELEFIAENEDHEVYLLEVHPGGFIPVHYHSSQELVVVLRGEIEFTINGQTSIASQGNLVTIPADQLHSGRNLRSESTLLLCVYAPAGLRQSLTQKTYEELAISGVLRL